MARELAASSFRGNTRVNRLHRYRSLNIAKWWKWDETLSAVLGRAEVIGLTLLLLSVKTSRRLRLTPKKVRWKHESHDSDYQTPGTPPTTLKQTPAVGKHTRAASSSVWPWNSQDRTSLVAHNRCDPPRLTVLSASSCCGLSSHRAGIHRLS